MKIKNHIKYLENQLHKYHQFILFLCVGCLNTAFGYSVFALGIFLGLHYSIAALMATILGTLFNFKTTGKIVFKNSNNKLIYKFILVYIVQYFANISLIKFFLFTGMNVYIAGATSAFFCAIVSYTLSKNFVFKINSREVNL